MSVLQFYPLTFWTVSGLKTFLKKKGLTQKKAAKMLGISQSYLCDIAKGRRRVGSRLMDAIQQLPNTTQGDGV